MPITPNRSTVAAILVKWSTRHSDADREARGDISKLVSYISILEGEIERLRGAEPHSDADAFERAIRQSMRAGNKPDRCHVLHLQNQLDRERARRGR